MKEWEKKDEWRKKGERKILEEGKNPTEKERRKKEVLGISLAEKWKKVRKKTNEGRKEKEKY